MGGKRFGRYLSGESWRGDGKLSPDEIAAYLWIKPRRVRAWMKAGH